MARASEIFGVPNYLTRDVAGFVQMEVIQHGHKRKATLSTQKRRQKRKKIMIGY